MTVPVDEAGATDRAFALLQELLPQQLLSRGMHRLARSTNPMLRNATLRAVLRAYPQIDLGEAAEPDPFAYPSFNAFFTRALPGDRQGRMAAIVAPEAFNSVDLSAMGFQVERLPWMGAALLILSLLVTGRFGLSAEKLYNSPKLYSTFLSDDAEGQAGGEPNPGKIDRLFSKAVERRTKGRPGLYMQSRFPALPIVAGLMFGEIGQGSSGHNLMRHWCVSNLLLADEFHPRSSR